MSHARNSQRTIGFGSVRCGSVELFGCQELCQISADQAKCWHPNSHTIRYTYHHYVVVYSATQKSYEKWQLGRRLTSLLTPKIKCKLVRSLVHNYNEAQSAWVHCAKCATIDQLIKCSHTLGLFVSTAKTNIWHTWVRLVFLQRHNDWRIDGMTDSLTD